MGGVGWWGRVLFFFHLLNFCHQIPRILRPRVCFARGLCCHLCDVHVTVCNGFVCFPHQHVVQILLLVQDACLAEEEGRGGGDRVVRCRDVPKAPREAHGRRTCLSGGEATRASVVGQQ